MHIDYSIRMLIGSLREHGMLDDTIMVFMSDHGDMLFDHGMVAKRLFYESSASIPLIFSGKPMQEYRNRGFEHRLCCVQNRGFEHRLCCVQDVMPTLLDLCGIRSPEGIDGIPVFGDHKREYIYGEISEGPLATHAGLR